MLTGVDARDFGIPLGNVCEYCGETEQEWDITHYFNLSKWPKQAKLIQMLTTHDPDERLKLDELLSFRVFQRWKERFQSKTDR